MTNSVLTWLENEWAKIKGSTAVATVEADAESIGGAGWAYIKNNGLADLYQIALTLVGAMVPGASWTGVLAAIVVQAKSDGVALLQGAEAVVAGQAQADLLAAGKPAGLPVVPLTGTPPGA